MQALWILSISLIAMLAILFQIHGLIESVIGQIAFVNGVLG